MSPRLAHITTVPMTLHFLRGQPGFMASRDVETHVISSPGPDLAAFLDLEPTVEAHTVPMSRSISPLGDLRALGRMIHRIRRLSPDIVHTHTPKAGLLGVLAARIVGTPVVFHHIHGGVWLDATGMRRRIARWTDLITCQLAHRVFCVSNSVRAALVREGLCPPEKVEVLAGGSINGVDGTDRFNPEVHRNGGATTRRKVGIPADAVVIGFVGRLTGEKGILELRRAWERIRETHRSAHLLLVGPEDPVSPLPPGEMDALRHDDRVHFAGMNWNTPPLYAAMDVLVLPTYREGFPVVLLEAAAMALPIVATGVPGCTDAVVDGVTGLLVPARDAEQLHHAIRRYVADRELRRRHGDAGRARVLREFRPERIWSLLADQYEAGLASRPARQPVRSSRGSES